MSARFIALVALLVPFPAAAATLYLAPARVVTEAGVPSTVELLADVSESVHAAEADVRYDQTYIRVQSISHVSSLLTNFSTEPVASGGSIRFSGWMEKPFTGTGGELVAVTFMPLRSGTTTLEIQSGTLLAADVQENNVVTGLAPATIVIGEHRVSSPAVPHVPAGSSATTTATTTAAAVAETASSSSATDIVPVADAASEPASAQTAAAGASQSFFSIPVDYLVLAAAALGCVALGFFIAYLFFRAGRPRG